MAKNRSNVKVLIRVKDRGNVGAMFDVTAHVKVGDKPTRIAKVGSSNTIVGATKMATKAKAGLIKRQGIPGSNIKIKGT